MNKAYLQPAQDGYYIIAYNHEVKEGINFKHALEKSQRQEVEGDIQAACNTRFVAFQALAALIPEDEDVMLAWEDANNQNALLLLHCSAIDHFLIGDLEMCAAMLEMLLDLDPEDHFEATKHLAYTYLALGEYELFDEIKTDLNDKGVDLALLTLWFDFQSKGEIEEAELVRFKKNFPEYYNEFVNKEHPTDNNYLNDIESPRPARATLARRLWLQTEILWSQFPQFIDALKTGI